jgi:hypothetical protein
MIQIEYLPIVLTGIGIMASILYYASVIRNQNRTRQAQMFMQIYHQVSSKSFQRDWIELMNMEWEDYDDFERKYGSDNNPENFAMRASQWMAMNGVGAMLRDGLIEPEKLVRLVGQSSQFLWAKFRPIIIEWRVRYGMPQGHQDFEYLAEALEKELIRMNEDFKLPETLTRYVPDE